MKKYIILLSLLSVFFLSSFSQTLEINGITYKVDTLENHQVGPGTQYIALRLMPGGTGAFNAFFLKSDLSNPYVQVRTVLSRDSIYGGEAPSAAAKRKSTEGAFYFAGTNGDFYNTTDYVGWPIGGNMVDNQLAKAPNARAVFAIDELKVPDIGVMSYEGYYVLGEDTTTINSVNHTRGENRLVLFNQLNGKYTHTNQYGTEVLIELLDGHNWGSNRTLQAKVIKIEAGVGNMAIPEGQAVLSGHGTTAAKLNLLSENDVITIDINLKMNGNLSHYAQMTSGDGYAPMLWNGVVEQSNIWNELHPRTGLGFSQDKKALIFCVVDGRSGVSTGVTTKQLAELMKSAGAYTAFNMDGGGSSCMYISEYGGPVNQVSDGNERAVGNSIFVVSTAPTDNEVGIIKPYKSSISLPLYGEHIPQFYGYNQYETLLNSDLQGVVLSCPESLGTIVGNKFIATGTTSGAITATYNETVTALIQVDFVPVSAIAIRLDSVIVDNRSDYPVDVVATTEFGTAPISSAALVWTVADPEICQVENGVVKALKNGTTTITGEIDETTDELKVKVEIPASHTIAGDKMLLSDWTISVASQYSDARLNHENLPQGWEHGAAVNFTHKTGRSPFVKLTNQTPLYGLPDTLKIVLNIGEIAVEKAIVSLKANNSSTTVSATIDSFEANKDFSLNIPMSALFDTSDRGIYPIWFDNMNFQISASGTPVGAKTLAIKELQLVYDGYMETSIPFVDAPNFYIYPNPVTDKTLYLQLKDNHSQTVRTEIYSLSGQVLQSDLHGVYGGNAIQLSIKKLVPGAYLLKVFENEKWSTMKFVVK